MDDEHEQSRMKEASNDMKCLISSLNFFIEEYVQLAGEEIVDVVGASWLSWWIWHGVEKSIWV
jgi:hypothetical protein